MPARSGPTEMLPMNSRGPKVFVSIFGDENTDENSRTKAITMAFLQGFNRSVKFYQAASANNRRHTGKVSAVLQLCPC
ncbi:hypothetical protein KO116_02542 [Halomonas sp. KO116]|nr:hypothetical protein KO116_02542 [Halomonas sp. KO116]